MLFKCHLLQDLDRPGERQKNYWIRKWFPSLDQDWAGLLLYPCTLKKLAYFCVKNWFPSWKYFVFYYTNTLCYFRVNSSSINPENTFILLLKANHINKNGKSINKIFFWMKIETFVKKLLFYNYFSCKGWSTIKTILESFWGLWVHLRIH